MKHSLIIAASLAIFGAGQASAATFLFDTDPFEGTTALSTPGRQIIGNEDFITFKPGLDSFAFDPDVFDFGGSISFFNGLAGDLAGGTFNLVVLRSLDDDGDPATPFGAGPAASLIAGNVGAAGPGAFVYFNSGLDLPRLVYSTDLADPGADLRILARMTNFGGNPAGLADFTADNFELQSSAVPEPTTWALLLLGFGAIGVVLRASRGRQRLAVSHA